MTVGEQGRTEILEFGPPDDWQGPQEALSTDPGFTPPSRWPIRAVAVMACVIGVVIGAAGATVWQRQADERAAQSRVDLLVDAPSTFSVADPTWDLSVRDLGPSAVQILGIDVRRRGVHVQPERSDLPVRVRAGRSKRVSLALGVECAAADAAPPRTAVLRVRTADGTERTSRVAFDQPGRVLAEAHGTYCRSQSADRPVTLAYDGGMRVAGETVAVALRVRNGGGQPFVLSDVSSASGWPALHASSAPGGLLRVPGGATRTLHLRWDLSSCSERAADAFDSGIGFLVGDNPRAVRQDFAEPGGGYAGDFFRAYAKLCPSTR